jgi:hypothetical protein
MRITAMAAMLVAVGMSARAEQTVKVYIEDDSVVPYLVMNRARLIAAKMFAGAGVRIEWHGHTPNSGQLPAGAVVIGLASHTPESLLPSAFALALPYEGVHITVFWDRVERKTCRATAHLVLAHVLVHEITHLLQRMERHSESGVMKACWTGEDYSEMTLKGLPFTPEDIDLIHRGLASRAGAGTLVAAHSAPGVEARQ